MLLAHDTQTLTWGPASECAGPFFVLTGERKLRDGRRSARPGLAIRRLLVGAGLTGF
jgi:hypothetical protein